MRIKLYTDNRTDKEGRYPVRLSVSFLGHRHITSLGCAMTRDEFDAFRQCYQNEKPTTKVRHQRHNELLRVLHSISDRLEWEIEKVKRGELSRDAVDIAGIVNECKGSKKRKTEVTEEFAQLYLRFISDEQKSKDLSKATLNQAFGIYRDVKQAFPGLSIDRASSKEWLQEYINMMVLRGYNSNTVRSKYRYIHWFLKWAFRNGYCNDDFARFKFELKIASPQERLVVFLTMDEIMAIKNYDADPNDVLCRDIFLFQCFTGLRYSDAIKVKNTDIRGDMLTIVSQKTGILLHNKLNNYALEVVNKYHDKFGETLFPYVSDGTINIHIRRVCKQAGIMELVTKYEYRNHERVEITGPKWQFITTHVGRKSFVVNSLDMGLTPTQVMGYTGHSSIMAMHPYVSISQKKKDAAMDVWNHTNAASEIEQLNKQVDELKRRIEALKSSTDDNS